jgi:hypothetical protein
MLTRSPSRIKHLDRDGRVTFRARGVDVTWRVVPADRERVDPEADYLFCAPDFLFPVDSSERALRVEIVDRQRSPKRPRP